MQDAETIEERGVGGAGGKELDVRLIQRREEDRWNKLMAAHHYLGFRRLVGETLKYVAEEEGEWKALVGWGAAAYKCGSRDSWIGWSEGQRNRRLRYVANNQRFLVLPEGRRPNLASRVLGANVRRLSGDWEAIFGHPIVIAETFVDPQFRGTCYRAAGWEELGQTSGYRRNGGRYYYHGRPKTIWVRQLCRRGREYLAAPLDPPLMRSGGDALFDLNIALDSEDGILKLLSELPDPRLRRGRRHQFASVLAVAICACLAGMRNFAAIGEWAADLPPEALERLHCRWHPVQQRYIAPSEPTLRRALQSVDADLIDRLLGGWLERKAGPGEAIAVDGKTLRGAVRLDGTQVHLLAALLHKEGVVLNQREVDVKHNEITEFRPLLEPLDLAGMVVTADALHTQRDHASFLVEDKEADYVFTVKGNQPNLEAAVRAIPAGSFSPSGGDLGQGPRPS
jgi:uncharacterized protein DUF4338/DDE family transposase